MRATFLNFKDPREIVQAPFYSPSVLRNGRTIKYPEKDPFRDRSAKAEKSPSFVIPSATGEFVGPGFYKYENGTLKDDLKNKLHSKNTNEVLQSDYGAYSMSSPHKKCFDTSFFPSTSRINKDTSFLGNKSGLNTSSIHLGDVRSRSRSRSTSQNKNVSPSRFGTLDHTPNPSSPNKTRTYDYSQLPASPKGYDSSNVLIRAYSSASRITPYEDPNSYRRERSPEPAFQRKVLNFTPTKKSNPKPKKAKKEFGPDQPVIALQAEWVMNQLNREVGIMRENLTDQQKPKHKKTKSTSGLYGNVKPAILKANLSQLTGAGGNNTASSIKSPIMLEAKPATPKKVNPKKVSHIPQKAQINLQDEEEYQKMKEEAEMLMRRRSSASSRNSQRSNRSGKALKPGDYKRNPHI